MMDDSFLSQAYRTIRYAFVLLNKAFYNGRLPRPSFIYDGNVVTGDLYAETHCFLHEYEIHFFPAFLEALKEEGPSLLCMVVLHEMAHVAIDASRRFETDSHGELFKRMCELHGLLPIWCGEEHKWAETELQDHTLAVFGKISDYYTTQIKKGGSPPPNNHSTTNYHS